MDFTQALETDFIAQNHPLFLQLARRLNLTITEENETEILQALAKWMQCILTTPLMAENPLCFAQIKMQDRLNEMEFFFKITHKFNATKFNKLLANYHHLKTEPLELGAFKGMMHGFIDLVFRHEGKYYLVDYKSSFLGASYKAYQNERLQEKMQSEHYDWQYLIYCVALHRYLKMRLPNYQYTQDFGGVIYPFLRGMNGTPSQGVYFDKPEEALIVGLEELF